MKLNTPDNVLMTSNTQSQGFTIEASAKAFDVLSSKMYEEPILAIIRELSCNAYDSHVEAGKPEVPFSVHLPTTFEPWLEIQDYGVGLPVASAEVETSIDQVESEAGLLYTYSIYVGTDLIADDKMGLFKHVYDDNRVVLARILGYDDDRGVLTIDKFVEAGEVHFDAVLDLYTSYFSSTKTQSNDVIGAFGLGSKTPFAYVDAFTVTNVYDQYKYKYSIRKDSNGPEISLVTVVEVEDDNGLTIHMPIKASDTWDFRNAAERTYKWFDVQPECDIDLKMERPVWEGKNFSLFENTGKYTSKRVFIKQGQVAYELSLDKVSGVDQTVFKCLNDNLDLVLHFDIGEIDVSASRESVHFCDMTNQSIIDRAKAALEELNEYGLDKVTGAANIFDLREDYLIRTFHKIIDLGDTTLKDLLINVDFGETTTPDGFRTNVRFSYNTDKERPQRTGFKTLPWNRKPVFVYKDKVQPTNTRITDFYVDEFTDVILVNKRDMPYDEFETVVKSFGITDPQYICSSEIPFPKAEREAMERKRPGVQLKYRTYSNDDQGDCTHHIDSKLDTIEIVQDMIDEGRTVIFWDQWGVHDFNWFEAVRLYKRLNPTQDFVFVGSPYKRVWETMRKNFGHLSVAIDDLYEIRAAMIEAEQQDIFERDLYEHIQYNYDGIRFANMLTRGDYFLNVYAEIAENIEAIKKRIEFDVSSYRTDRKLSKIRREIRSYMNIYDFDAKWVIKKYPMIGLSSSYSLRNQHKKVKEYIDLVDNTEEAQL